MEGVRGLPRVQSVTRDTQIQLIDSNGRLCTLLKGLKPGGCLKSYEISTQQAVSIISLL